MSQVHIEHIFKTFGKEKVLNNVSFHIGGGEIFGLIGPNGAGKSTLIDIITGLQKADSGSITVDGLKVPKDITKIRANLGLVPQEIALIPDISARANLKYFGGLYGMIGKELNQKVEEALEVVGLKDQKKAVKKFSGGMQRRLNLACAIMHQPTFLILDEPTVGVDPQSRHTIFEFIKSMNDQYGTTVLYTSHYMEEVEALCPRIFIMDKGKQVAYGSQEEIKMLVQDSIKWHLKLKEVDFDFVEKLKTLPGVDQVIDQANEFQLLVNPLRFDSSSLLQLLHEEELEFLKLAKDELSLEEAFLQLTGKSLRD